MLHSVRVVRSAWVVPVLLAVVLTLSSTACGPDDGLVVEPKADAAWERWSEAPSANTYLGFIQANRKAALVHPYADDTLGVLYQVRAIEAQSFYAVQTKDLQIASDVLARVDDLRDGDLLAVFEDVFPGARERLLAAHARVDPLMR